MMVSFQISPLGNWAVCWSRMEFGGTDVTNSSISWKGWILVLVLIKNSPYTICFLVGEYWDVQLFKLSIDGVKVECLYFVSLLEIRFIVCGEMMTYYWFCSLAMLYNMRTAWNWLNCSTFACCLGVSGIVFFLHSSILLMIYVALAMLWGREA